MERVEYRDVVDKSEWPRGEWDNEPDKIQWPDEATGLPCLIVRNQFGSLCGYVGVSEGHRFYGKSYRNADAVLKEAPHGGITFANSCTPDADETRDICHRPGKGEPDHVWWLGFDCGHCFDIAPGMSLRHQFDTDHPSMPKSKYRNIEYVAQECRQLAKQLKELA